MAGALFTPVTPWGNVYCPLESAPANWSTAKHIRTESWFGAPDHLVRDGQLYLRAQSTRHGLFFTCVDVRAWCRRSLEQYRAKHPALDALWPNTPIPWLNR